MKVFLISQEAALDKHSQLAAFLSQVELQPSLLINVVVIDECTWSAPQAQTVPTIKTFMLDDFLHERGSVNNGEFISDANVIGSKLSTASESWLVIDFGLHQDRVTMDFINKLATFTFLFKGLRDKNIVLLMPSLKLGYMARYVNCSFNSTASCAGSEADANRFQMFLFSTLLEKALLSSPFIAWPVSRLRQLVRFFYRRIARVRT